MAKKKAKQVSKPKKKRVNVSNVLERLDKMEASGALGSGGSGSFWKPDPGTHTIRVLPPVGDMEYFFVFVGRHYLGRTPYTCPRVTESMGDDCPICERYEELNRGSKADKQMAKELYPRKQYWMNILVRDDDGFKGPFVYTPGPTVMDEIVTLLRDPDYGEDILDPMDGIDIRIVREGRTRTDTSYSVVPTRKPVPANDEFEGDEDGMWEWIEDNVEDLTDFVKIPEYDELSDAIEGADQDVDTEDVNEVLRRASKRKRPAKSKRKKRK